MRWKKAALVTVLGTLAIWPIPHYFLVDALEASPWRFCGFAMYATPSPYQRLYIIELRGDREVHLHSSWFTDGTQAAIRDYKRRREVLGKLLPPHALAETILAERPEIEGLKIVLQRDLVSAKTSRVTPQPATAYIYRR